MKRSDILKKINKLLTSIHKRVKMSSVFNNTKTKTNKNERSLKMKTQKTKQNIIAVAKTGVIAGLVAGGVYFGIPTLSLQDVLSLVCLSSAFALAFTLIRR